MSDCVHDGHRERMRQRFLAEGLDSFQPHEVLELLLFYAIPRRNTSELAHRLLNHFGGKLYAVLDAPPEALMQVDGISLQSATLISMIAQLLRKYNKEKFHTAPTLVDTTEKLVQVCTAELSHLANEAVFLICMDSKFKLLDSTILTTGTVSSTDVTVRMILQRALMFNASAVVLAHNHPSGDATPSRADIATTLQIVRALKMAEVYVWDHIVIAGDDFVSMRENPVWCDIFE